MTEGKHSYPVMVTATLFSSVIYVGSFNPFDVIRTQQQLLKSNRPLAVTRYIFDRYGLKGFYAGISPNIITVSTTNFFYFPLYEIIRCKLEPYAGSLSFGISGLMARLITITALSPIEKYKTQTQAAEVAKISIDIRTRHALKLQFMRDGGYTLAYWTILENFYRYFKDRSEFGARAGGAMLGAATAVLVSQPFDVMKTRVEAQY